jgi:hypothetical protein
VEIERLTILGFVEQCFFWGSSNLNLQQYFAKITAVVKQQVIRLLSSSGEELQKPCYFGSWEQ